MKFVADEFRLTDRLYVRISLKYKWFTDCDQDFPQIRRRRISLYLGPSITPYSSDDGRDDGDGRANGDGCRNFPITFNLGKFG